MTGELSPVAFSERRWRMMSVARAQTYLSQSSRILVKMTVKSVQATLRMKTADL